MRFNSIIVTPVRSLEVGDLFAYESLGMIISGKITGKAYTKYELTNEQLAYMMNEKLWVPKDDDPLVALVEPLGGVNSYLLFGEFTNHPNHIYLGFDVNVVVFPTKEQKEQD